MTKLRLYMTIPCLLLGVLLFAGTSRAQTRPAIVEQLAKTYGLDSYGQIEALRYTFNLELPALKVNLARTWTWEPKTGAVTYESKDKDGKPVKVSYNRNQISSAPANVKDDVDPAFMNDNYWAIFPFHVYWDTSATVTVTEKQKLPIGKGTATLVSVKYGAEGGGGWRLHAGRYLESLRRAGRPSRAVRLPARRPEKAEQRHNDMGRLREGRPTAVFDRPSRNGGRQAGADLLYECGREAGGVGQVDGRDSG